MEQVIIDVVLGLVLIYITLSLLAMKVQEVLAEHQKGECLPSEDRR